MALQWPLYLAGTKEGPVSKDSLRPCVELTPKGLQAYNQPRSSPLLSEYIRRVLFVCFSLLNGSATVINPFPTPSDSKQKWISNPCTNIQPRWVGAYTENRLALHWQSGKDVSLSAAKCFHLLEGGGGGGGGSKWHLVPVNRMQRVNHSRLNSFLPFPINSTDALGEGEWAMRKNGLWCKVNGWTWIRNVGSIARSAELVGTREIKLLLWTSVS